MPAEGIPALANHEWGYRDRENAVAVLQLGIARTFQESGQALNDDAPKFILTSMRNRVTVDAQ